MNAQQLLDYIIKPTLEYMGGNYNSKNAQMLLLSTAAIESKCGYYIKQINGPALGIWQMEPATHQDIWDNSDVLQDNSSLCFDLMSLAANGLKGDDIHLIASPMYACAMARLKYSMDIAPLPHYKDIAAIYREYKRIYNTHLGKSTYEKFEKAYFDCGLDKVVF